MKILYPIAAVSCTAFIFLSPAHSDDKYVYSQVFNGALIDDGVHNTWLANLLFENLNYDVKDLNSQTGDIKSQISAGFLLYSMLELRAFCEQRSDKLNLTPSQKDQLKIVLETLSSMDLSNKDNNISYRFNEEQFLVDECALNAKFVTKLKTMSQSESFK